MRFAPPADARYRRLPVRRLLAAAVVCVLSVDVLVLVAGLLAGPAAAQPAQATNASLSRVVPSSLQPSPVAVAPLERRLRADVIVLSPRPLTPGQRATVRRVAHPGAQMAIDTGRIRLGHGRTTAVGVDPSTFRAFTPRGTAGVDALWEAVARGDAAVAHSVAGVLRAPLGQSMRAAGPSGPMSLRVGAFATTGLPNVGVVVSREVGADLGLAPHSGLVLSLRREADAPAVAATLRRRLDNVRVATVQTFVTVRTRRAWVAPAAGTVSSGFGRRAYPLDPDRVDFHPGIDIAAPKGAPVWAAASGTVLYSGPAPGFGNEIVLLHDDGVTTVYGHMSRLLVSGGSVRVGQPIALVGSEGESTGPHLHFEVRLGDRRVDPIAWLRDHGVPIGS